MREHNAHQRYGRQNRRQAWLHKIHTTYVAIIHEAIRTSFSRPDFGFARQVDEHGARVSTPCGSYSYAAPELFADRVGSTYDAKKADVWSMYVYVRILLVIDVLINAGAVFSTQWCAAVFHSEMIAKWRKT